ncbi:MAG: hypothetical protein NUV60_00230 [Patescibacteria group bacterium]|nr:hypothetical protein [Patescibacteria group bacterium]
MRLGLFTTFLSILLLPVAASAQSLGGIGDASGGSFTVSVAPQFPVPYSTATLSFLSSSIDLANATITVTADGKKIYQGSSQPVSLPLGGAGSSVDISVAAVTNESTYTQYLSIQPQDVALVAEPLSSAPPLYLGKPSVPPEGSVRVVAMANLRSAGGGSLNPTALSYIWTVDGAQIANSSGIGKAAIIVASPLQYRARTVAVSVTSQDGSLVGGANLSLSVSEPLIRVYENDPLLGIRFEKALSGTYTIKGTESTLYAAPFSFATSGGPPLLQWLLNGGVAQTGSLITLRPSGGGQGRASLSLIASEGQFTTITTNLSLSFGNTPSPNFFGL